MGRPGEVWGAGMVGANGEKLQVWISGNGTRQGGGIDEDLRQRKQVKTPP